MKGYLSHKLSCASRLAKAFTGLKTLNRQADSLVDRPEEMTSLLFGYGDAFLRPFQIQGELASLLTEVRRLNPRTVLEIGTCSGGTLYLWTRLAQPDATILSIDLPGGKFGGGYSLFRKALYRRFARRDQSLHLLRADSHSPSTLREVKRLLGGRRVDLLFIDGDHTFEGVRNDWTMYSPLLSETGMVAFHDVAGNFDDTQVKQFWDSIKTVYQHREYIDGTDGRFGIGLLYPTPQP